MPSHGTGTADRRTSLRPFELNDSTFLRDVHNDLEAQRSAFRAPAFPKAASEFERRIADRFPAPFTAAQGSMELAVIAMTEPGEPVIGVAGLYSVDLHNQSAEAGVSIADPKRRGLGLGADALRGLIEVAFGHLGLHRLYCHVKADNPAGLALVATTGFTREATLREHRRHGDGYVDVIVFGLLASEAV